MSLFVALVLRDKTRNRQRIFRFHKVDHLPVGVGLERRERCEKINRFEDAGLALRVIPDEQYHALGTSISRRAKLRKLVRERCLDAWFVMSDPTGFRIP